jgi:hypothetical protein
VLAIRHRTLPTPTRRHPIAHGSTATATTTTTPTTTGSP